MIAGEWYDCYVLKQVPQVEARVWEWGTGRDFNMILDV